MSYWKQFLLALLVALGFGYLTYTRGRSLLVAGGVVMLTYVVIRGIITWIMRTKYWYRKGTSKGARSCPDCNQYVHLQSGDWILTCKECGWRAGWPGIRLLTRSVPAVQFRRTLRDPVLGIRSSGRRSLTGRLRGTIRSLASLEFIVLSIVLLSAAGAAGVEFGVIDGDQVPNPDSEAVFGEGVDDREVEQVVHTRLNEIREDRGLSPVELDDGLSDVARAHSQDMASRGFFAHQNPDGEGPFDRVAQSSVECRAVAENIAQSVWDQRVETESGVEQFDTNEELGAGLVTQWMNSPPHRENMLDGQWETIGVGVHVTDDNTVFATQVFCR